MKTPREAALEQPTLKADSYSNPFRIYTSPDVPSPRGRRRLGATNRIPQRHLGLL